MASKEREIFNTSFDVSAENYHSIRPGYPSALYKDIKKQCDINKASKLLEIGVGSGMATVELAKIGCSMVAIEPGSHLVAIAKKQTERFQNVKILKKTFEEFNSSNNSFDVVLAFTSFHWLKKKDKYQRIAEMINDSGSLVLVWNWFFQSNSSASIAVNKAYHELLFDVYPNQMNTGEINEMIFTTLVQREREVIQNPFFYPVFLKKYLVNYDYDAQSYSNLLNTFPKIIAIEAKRKSRFLERIFKTIARHGKISVPVLTSLIICKKKKYFLETVEGAY